MSRRSAFSLIELLVVIAIIGVLIGLLLPAIQKVRESGIRMQILNDLKQMALACHSFESENGYLPPAFVDIDNNDNAQWKSMAGSTHYFILPYIDQSGLYRISAGEGNSFFSVYQNYTVKSYLNPADTSVQFFNDSAEGFGTAYGLTGYAANYQSLGYFLTNENNQILKLAQISDGTSNTIFLAEKNTVCINPNFKNPESSDYNYYNIWAYGRTDWNEWNPVFAYQTTGAASKFQIKPLPTGPGVNCNPTLASTPRDSGIMIALGDGSGRMLSSSVSPSTWWAACTPKSGDQLASDW